MWISLKWTPIVVANVMGDSGFVHEGFRSVAFDKARLPGSRRGGGGRSPRWENFLLVLSIVSTIAVVAACEALT